MTCGVYQILNVSNGHCYVGSSKDVEARLYEHGRLLRNGKHHSIALQRAWLKYREEAFVFRAITECDSERLLAVEQELIERLSPEYNMAPVAGSLLGRKRSVEERAAQSARQRGNKAVIEHCARIAVIAAKSNLGKNRSSECRLKISSALRGKKHPPERCATNGAAHRGKKKPASWGENISAKLRGRAKTPEHQAKITASLRAHYERKLQGKYKGSIPTPGIAGGEVREAA